MHEAHISRDGHNFRQCAPDVRTFSLENKLVFIQMEQEKVVGCTVVKSLHPLSAENKTLLSNTGNILIDQPETKPDLLKVVISLATVKAL